VKVLIDRDDLLQEIYGMIPESFETPPEGRDWQIEINAVQKILDSVVKRIMDKPTVELIECKECRYAQLSLRDEVKYCDIWFPYKPQHLPKEHFCGLGERRRKK